MNNNFKLKTQDEKLIIEAETSEIIVTLYMKEIHDNYMLQIEIHNINVSIGFDMILEAIRHYLITHQQFGLTLIMPNTDPEHICFYEINHDKSDTEIKTLYVDLTNRAYSNSSL